LGRCGVFEAHAPGECGRDVCALRCKEEFFELTITTQADGMKGFISSKQIDYVLFHLGHSVEIHEKIRERIVFVRSSAEIQPLRNKIIFPLSDNELDITTIKWVDNIPILFPIAEDERFFTIENGNVIFTDDLLKSSFYLLSGCQEYRLEEKDIYGRFPFEKSLQHALGITDRPIVNYYFEQITNAIERFCEHEHIDFRRKQLFENFGFMLTHDVDRVDAYDYYRTAYTFKQLIGLAPSPYDTLTTLKVFAIALYHFVNIFSKTNTFWNFQFLRSIEKANGFRSVFYILKNEGKLDALYSIQEKRILELLEYLSSEHCEIGIHGTMKSALELESLRSALGELQQAANNDVVGCRQHFLRFYHPQTMLIQEQCGIKYDTTLSFAEYEGFRNSYCLPFKLYHFEEERMIDVWEIPLNVMEVTLFGYRNLSFEQAQERVDQLISEIQKFHGIFTMLWHNCFFDEFEHKGITAFYEKLIVSIKGKNPTNVTGIDALALLSRSGERQFQFIRIEDK
jgi:hypothetical protein